MIFLLIIITTTIVVTAAAFVIDADVISWYVEITKIIYFRQQLYFLANFFEKWYFSQFVYKYTK